MPAFRGLAILRNQTDTITTTAGTFEINYDAKCEDGYIKVLFNDIKIIELKQQPIHEAKITINVDVSKLKKEVAAIIASYEKPMFVQIA